MFHGNLVPGSSGNITPYPRKIVYLTLNAVSNYPHPTRPEYIAHRDFTPIRRRTTTRCCAWRGRPGGGGVVRRVAHIVMPGLVPGMHVATVSRRPGRGWPGIGERKRRRPSDGQARP